MELSGKQEVFCREYLVDLNAKQAAIRAKYSPDTAESQASRLLTNVKVQERIQELQKERSLRTQITQDRVLLEIARLAFNDPRKAFDENGDLLPVQQWPDEVAAAISSIKVTEIKEMGLTVGQLKEIRFWDKGKQIELAGKHLGIFTENVKLSGGLDVKISKIQLVPLKPE